MKPIKRDRYLSELISRRENGLIKVITGIRRCGKSVLMQTIADELKASGTDERNIIYIDLDLRENRNVKTADQLEALLHERFGCRTVKGFVDREHPVMPLEI